MANDWLMAKDVGGSFAREGNSDSPNLDFLKKPIRATVAKEAGQEMSTEETAVRPDQILKLVRPSSFRIDKPDEYLRKNFKKIIIPASLPKRNVKDRCQSRELAFRLTFSEAQSPVAVAYRAANRRFTFLSELLNRSSCH